jgi:hypothetical protein
MDERNISNPVSSTWASPLLSSTDHSGS